MFDHMEVDKLTNDQIERLIAVSERKIGGIRELQMMLLAEADTRQLALADGCRSLGEWLAARADLNRDNANSLTRTMRRLRDRPDLESALGDGEITFDRAEALSRIAPEVGLMEWSDVDGVRREAAKRARMTADAEYRTYRDRFLVVQPTLDRTWYRLWGGLDGLSGSIVDKALTEAADAQPEHPDGFKPDLGWRKATALVETMTGDNPPPAQVSVVIDASDATPTGGQAGVTLESGARVGREALQAILCDATTEILVRASDGRYMDYGRSRRTAPPGLRRALLHKYGHTCAADGCNSRTRLQVHHLTPWSRGGATDQHELVLLCWFHHHVVVHQRGYTIYETAHGRFRFRAPRSHDPPG